VVILLLARLGTEILALTHSDQKRFEVHITLFNVHNVIIASKKRQQTVFTFQCELLPYVMLIKYSRHISQTGN